MRIEAKAVFEDNQAVKEAFLENPKVKKNFETADNPKMEVFYLSEGRAVIADHSGNPPREFTL